MQETWGTANSDLTHEERASLAESKARTERRLAAVATLGILDRIGDPV